MHGRERTCGVSVGQRKTEGVTVHRTVSIRQTGVQDVVGGG